LRKLLRGPLPVKRGRQTAYVEGPVDYSQLDTEFIGLIYEGLLDYRVRRSDEDGGPQVFLNIGREPVLPLVRLELMLQDNKKELKELLTKLKTEKTTKTASSDDDTEEEERPEEEAEQEEEASEAQVEEEAGSTALRSADYQEADRRALAWAREAVVLAGIARKKRRGQPDSEYQKYLDEEAQRLIKRVVPVGEFYLVRAGNVRKGTGTFYTKKQLATPTVHRTLEPLCYGTALESSQDDPASSSPALKCRFIIAPSEGRTKIDREFIPG